MSFFQDPFRPTTARGDDAPKAAPATAPVDESKRVPDGTSKEVLAWVDGDKERAQAALDKEESGDQPRKGLVKDLNEVLENNEDNDNDESTSA